ncbi:MAG: hypothetical protein E3J89_01965 [Candidatus Aminicenantes bacterium]|nr:MAG: hypothetical protein E3J89_01965 [Candidatus Aminicenantes bacterium]
MAKDELEAEFFYYETYFSIAHKAYSEAKKLETERLAIQKASPDAYDLIAKKSDGIERFTIVVILFCALAAEAYINDYGIENLSKNYFTKYLDKLDLVSKWIILPRIITGRQLNPGSNPMQDLSWLTGLRNKLAHSKSRKIPIDKIEKSDFFWIEDAEKSLGTIRNLIAELRKIDKNIHSDWIDI